MGPDLSENLARLRSVFGDGPLYVSDGEATVELDGVEFVCDYQPGSTSRRFYLLKNPDAVPEFVDRAREFAGGVVVELGIAEGGSVALLALAARPKALVAFELESRPVRALEDFAAEHGLGERLHLHYGVDQSDRSALVAALDSDLRGESLDLVIDDASHKLGPTRRSFETLFPLVRPGGLYVIEDWSAHHRYRAAVAQSLRDSDEETRSKMREAMRSAGRAQPKDVERPLSDLAVELLLVRAQEQELVGEVRIGRFDIAVRRGPAEIAPGSFRLAEQVKDYFGYLP
jgi:predicted O-methyltransferase YrrM